MANQNCSQIIFVILILLTSIVHSIPIKTNSDNEESITKRIIQGDILVRRKIVVNRSALKNVYYSAINVYAYEQTNISTWPDGIIPFELDTSLVAHKCLIQSAMLQIMLNTCVRFRAKSDEDRFYVKIFQDPDHPNVCYGTLGHNDELPVAEVSLPSGCHDIGTVVHELMHVIGFYHQHMRADRDEHLRINWHNIDPHARHNFELNKPNVEQIFTPWDFDSVMLYGPTGLSKDGQSVAMEPKQAGIEMKPVAKKPGLSKLDIVAIRQLYNCPQYRGHNFHENPHLIDAFGELIKSCPINSDDLLYIYLENV